MHGHQAPRNAHLAGRASHENGALRRIVGQSRFQNVHLPLAQRIVHQRRRYGPHTRFAAAPRRDFNRRAGQPGNGASLLLHALYLVDADPFGMAGGMIQNVTFEQIGVGVHPALHKLHHVEMHEFPAPFTKQRRRLKAFDTFTARTTCRDNVRHPEAPLGRVRDGRLQSLFVPRHVGGELCVGPRRQQRVAAA